MKIKDVALVRDEVLKGEVYGFVRLYNVIEGGIEAQPDFAFNITYPTTDIKNILDNVFKKLSGESEKGAFVFSGGYGTGKSHILLLLYHIFAHPDKGEVWLSKNGFDVDVPRGSKVIIMPLLNMNVTYLWEPFFCGLGRRDLLGEVGEYPTVSLIKKAIGDQVVVLITDELEAWYGVKEDEVIKNRNGVFLQNLTEVANEKGLKLLYFTSLYGRDQELMGILSRVQPIFYDLTVSRDRPKIVSFRLFENLDIGKAKWVVEEYVSKYKFVELDLGDFDVYRKRMVEAYPFHPELFQVLFERYSSSRNYQNTRGVLYLLSSVVRREFDKSDLILASNIEAESETELLQIDRELVEKCIADIKRNPIGFSRAILNTVLLYSLGEVKEKGATTQDIVLGCLRPQHNINDIYSTLNELKAKAWHMWEEDGRYVMKPEENILVVIQSEATRLVDEGKVNKALEVIRKLLKKDRSFYIHPGEEIPDNKEIKVVVSLSKMDTQALSDFYKGRRYRNSIILMVPRTKSDLTKDTDLLTLAQRIVLAEEKLSEVSAEKKQALVAVLQKDREEVKSRLDEIYGDWVKPIFIGAGRVEFRHVSCSISEIKPKVKASYDLESIKGEIAEALEGKEQGVIASTILEDFYKILGKPIILAPTMFDEAVTALCREGKIVVIKGGKVYDEKELPSKIEETMILKLKKYHRVEKVVEKGKRVVETERKGEQEEKEAKEGEGGIVIEVPTLIETEEYRTPFMLAQELERKLKENDLIRSANISISLKVKSFEQLSKLLEEFKIKDVKIEGEANLTITLTDYSRKDLLAILDRLPPVEDERLKARVEVKRGVDGVE